MPLCLESVKDVPSPRMTETEFLHELSIMRNDIEAIARSGGNASRYEAVLRCLGFVAAHLESMLLQFAQDAAHSDYDCRIKHSAIDNWARYFFALQRSVIQIRNLVEGVQAGQRVP
jgi:hypothetical protein